MSPVAGQRGFRALGVNAVFLGGCALVTAGVILHLPMFWMARDMGFRLAGMQADPAMLIGMALIVGGVGTAAYGLMPSPELPGAPHIEVEAPDALALRPAHWLLMFGLAGALVIDVMKPASLGFTISGMSAEYGLPKATVAVLPFSALTGTVLGSLLWGALADRYGRRATILLSAVMFVGTSICGTMPSFAWNVGMCLMMGMAAGGLLPVAYALLAEMMPRRHRGWSMVLVGGLGASGGYAAASLISAFLQPNYGWRILWLANLPTGLILIALGPIIPESAKFLAAHGRLTEAAAVLARFGAVARPTVRAAPEPAVAAAHPQLPALFIALSFIACAWGWANFGVLLWLPAELAEKGVEVGAASSMLAKSALIAVPTTFAAAVLYQRWGPRATLALASATMVAGVAMVLRLDERGDDPVAAFAVLLIGINAIIAVLLPFAAEHVPQSVRGLGTGWVAACMKGGGLLAQGLGLAGVVLSVRTATWALLLPTLVGMVLLVPFAWKVRRPAF